MPFRILQKKKRRNYRSKQHYWAHIFLPLKITISLLLEFSFYINLPSLLSLQKRKRALEEMLCEFIVLYRCFASCWSYSLNWKTHIIDAHADIQAFRHHTYETKNIQGHVIYPYPLELFKHTNTPSPLQLLISPYLPLDASLASSPTDPKKERRTIIWSLFFQSRSFTIACAQTQIR